MTSPTQSEILATKGYLTVERVATLMGVTRQRVYSMIDAGRIPALTVVQRKYIRREDLVAHVGKEAALVLGIVESTKARKGAA
jgi:excisionase family DNA binding protein